MIALALNLLLLGSAVALPAAAALALTRGAAPRLRYCGALLAFAAATAVPLWVTLRPREPVFAAAQERVDDAALVLADRGASRLGGLAWAAVAALLLARE